MATKTVKALGIRVTIDAKGAITGIKKIEKATAKAGRTAKKTSKGFKGLNSTFGALGATLGAAGVLRSVQAVTKSFADFEQQIANVQNITEVSNMEMSGMADTLRSLPSSLGTATDLTKGLYQALSSGVPKDNAIDFMSVNAKAAKGNLADLSQTISASTSILAAFQLPATEVTNVLDSMTKTVDLGKLTFTDLANNIGKSASIAAAAGVSYNELFAAAAQLTLGGLSVEEAMTGIRAIMTASISPTEDQAKAMKKLGIELSADAIAAQGFVGYMENVARVADENVTVMAELFPNVRAIGPALALAREGGAEFVDIFDQIAASPGKVERNFERMTATLSGQMTVLNGEFERAKITIGEALAPAIEDLVVKLADGMPAIADAAVSLIEQFQYLGESLEYLGILAVALMEALAVGKIMAWQAAMVEATGATAGFGVAIKTLAAQTVPMVAAWTAIAGAALATIKVYDMLADQMRENAELGMQQTMEYNDREQALLQQLKALNDLRTEQGLQRLSIEEYLVSIGGAKEGEQGWADSIKNRLMEMRVGGEITAEGMSMLEAYHGKVTDLTQAESDLGDEVSGTGNDFAANTRKVLENQRAVELLDKSLEDIIALYDQSAKWASENEKVWETFYDNINQGAGDWMFELEDLLEQGKISFEDFTAFVEYASDDLFRNKLEDDVGTWSEETAESANNLLDDLQQILGTGIYGPTVDMDIPKRDIWDGLTDGFADALGKGFMGEWAKFSDLWDAVWKDAAKAVTGNLVEGIESFMSSGSFKDLAASFDQGATGIVGGLGMVLQGREQGGAQGALQGAMGGATMGSSIGGMFGPIGSMVGGAIGAIAGAAISFFGGGDDPTVGLILNRNSSNLRTGGQDVSSEEIDLYNKELRNLYDVMRDAYRQVVLQFGDADLFDEVLRDKEAGVELALEPMEVDALFAWLKESKLPELFENQFFGAINAGLQNLGVNAATVTTLFSELGDMVGEDRVRFLAEFVKTVINLSKSLEVANWEDFRDAMNEDVLSSFVGAITDTTDQMDAMMESWKKMDLEDIAREVSAIGQSFDVALEGVADMMRQIDGMRQNIQAGWAGLSEDLKLSGMDPQGQIDYFNDQVSFWMDRLQDATTLEDIELANSNLMDYVNRLMGAVDLEGMTDSMFGETWRNYIQRIIDDAADTADSRLDEVEDVVQAAYDTLVERLNAAADALFNFTEAADEAAAGGGDTPEDPDDIRLGDEWREGASVKVHAPLTVGLQVNVNGVPSYGEVTQMIAENNEAWAEYLSRSPIE
jgi:TP901 family phage tail tape measure protein